MPNNSPARIAANNRYNRKTYETVSAQSPRVERLNDLLSIAARRAGVSKASYILDTLRARLRQDGITADDLPPDE